MSYETFKIVDTCFFILGCVAFFAGIISLILGIVITRKETRKNKDILKDILTLFDQQIDDYPCMFDHHGCCQQHGSFSLDDRDMCINEFMKRTRESKLP